MNSSEELIKKRNSLSQKHTQTQKSVCIILEASERSHLKPPGNPRIRNLPYGGCLCLPLFLSPFSPRGFQREKESPQLIWSTKGKTNKLPPTVCHPGTPSAAFQALACSPWSCLAQASSCRSAVLCACPEHLLLGLPEADTHYK